jgi:hypothetical protein
MEAVKMNDLFKDAEIISSYTRVQAIEDGMLVDITEFSREAGFKVPVAVTSGVFSILEPSEELKSQGQDLKGRMWDMLWILRLEIRKSEWTDTTVFAPLMIKTPGEKPEPVKMWAKAGPGDQMEMVITIMLEGED